MDSQNIKVYLAVSAALIVLLVLIIIIPFSKKSSPLTPNSLTPSPYSPFPTSIQTGSSPLTPNSLTPNPSIPVAFTGALNEPIPQAIIDLSTQKKDLRSKVPLNLTTFSIDFDYGEDKFVVTLKDPKDQSQKEFEGWRTSNYSGLGVEQFLIR